MMNNIFKLTLISTVVMLSGIGKGQAAYLQLTHDPLFLTQSVPPAIAVTFDDSGSMAWGFMGENMSNGGGTYDSRRFADPTENKMYFNPSIVYEPPIGDDGNELDASDPSAAPVDGFDANSPTVDLYNNYIPIARYYNYANGTIGMRFARIPDTPNIDNVIRGNWGAYPSLADRVATGRRAFLYDSKYDNGDDGNGNPIPPGKLYDIPDNQMQNFANWYTYYNTRNKLGKSSISRAFSTFGPSFKISWQQLNRNTTLPDLEEFDNTHREDFFEWLFDVPSDGGTPLRNAFFRAGAIFEDKDSYFSKDFNRNLTCQQNFHIAISDGEWNGTWSHTVDQDESTGAALAGDKEGRYTAYSGAGEQRIYPTDENFTSLSDIAFNFWSKDLVDIDDDVKLYKGDYTDAAGNDIVVPENLDDWDVPAFQWNPKNDPAYWQHVVTYNVGMGLESTRVVDYEAGRFGDFYVNDDNVVVPSDDDEARLIKACPQHPTITDPKEAVYAQIRAGLCDWPDNSENINNRRVVKVDDVWHSSINSRGDFFSANDPQELIDSLNQVVNNILERLSRGSASTVSSGVITASTRAYSPGFDSANWSGSMVARPVTEEGEFGDPIWDLSCNLTGGYCESTLETVEAQSPDDRNIYVIDSLSDTTEKFCDCDTPAITKFITSTSELLTDLGVTAENAVDYLKGKRDLEVSNGGSLRDRTSVLADIIHASPTVVRGPGAPYLDIFWPKDTPEYNNPYLKFKEDNVDRENMIYIGGNSGMLHAIKAEGVDEGKEAWGLIPSKALDNIIELVKPIYDHHSFVDNTPTVTDAYFNDSWRTVLVSGMRYGGQAFFAIDVTNPDVTEPKVLWEFSDEDDVDMGYSYGQAQIARITSTGDWVALIPNGYNNSEPDYLPANDPRNRVSRSGNAVLFVVRLSDGKLLAKLDTGVGDPDTPNGMATPVAVDNQHVTPPAVNKINQNIDIGADFIYAGDLYGNLWRFDIRSSNYSDWEDASKRKRLVAAQGVMEQPITTQPRVITLPTSTPEIDAVVMFGTGKYIETKDRSITLPKTQYLVGVFDGINSTPKDLNINSDNFIEQSLSGTSADNISTLSSKAVSSGNDSGWRIKLPSTGERIANPMAVLSNQLVLGTSIVPAGDDPCLTGGISRLIAFNPLTGGRPEIGGNGIFEGFDIVGTDPEGNPIREVVDGDAILVNDLIIGTPPVLENLGGGTSNIVVEGVEGNQSIALKQFTWRRRNWTNLLIE